MIREEHLEKCLTWSSPSKHAQHLTGTRAILECIGSQLLGWRGMHWSWANSRGQSHTAGTRRLHPENLVGRQARKGMGPAGAAGE